MSKESRVLSQSIVDLHAGPNVASASFDMLFMPSVSCLCGSSRSANILFGFDKSKMPDMIPDH